MEDYFWILILGAFWLFEITNKARKKRRQTEEEEPGTSRPDPRSALQELARGVDRSARRAEESLQRREEKQRESVPVPESVPGSVPVPVSAATRAPVDKTRRRREAFEAIAAMLAVPPEKMATAPVTQVQTAAAPGPPPATRPRPAPAASRGPDVESLAPPAVVRRRGRLGLRRLARLTEIQRAIVLSEILGPPVSLAKRSAFRLDSG